MIPTSSHSEVIVSNTKVLISSFFQISLYLKLAQINSKKNRLTNSVQKNYINIFIYLMHDCDCCSTCQYQLNSLRSRYQSLLLDYPKMKQKMLLANQTQQVYKQQNIQHCSIRVQQQAKINKLNAELRDYHEMLRREAGQQMGNEQYRKDKNRIDDLNKVISSKNGDINLIKNDLNRAREQTSYYRSENEALRKKNWELNQNIQNINNRIFTLETQVRESQAEMRRVKNLEETRQSRYESKRIEKSPKNQQDQNMKIRQLIYQLSPKCPHSNYPETSNKFNHILIQSKIVQLEYENSRLRQKLINKI